MLIMQTRRRTEKKNRNRPANKDNLKQKSETGSISAEKCKIVFKPVKKTDFINPIFDSFQC